MRNTINYTIGKDTLIIGERGEQNANDIVFNGFAPLSDDNTIFFVLDELTYPLMNNTVTVTFPMTAHSGLFVGQLVEKNAEGFVVNKSPVFKVKVTASVAATIEVTDPRFESLFEEYTRLYNEMLSLESELNEMKADVIESFEQIKTEFERIKTELAQDYADTKSSLIETVRTAIEEADGQIARAKDNALNDINQAKGNALSDIAQAKDDALDGINQAKDDGINDIETAKTNAVADGINQIETAKADIEQKKTEALADIDEVIQPFEAEYGSIPSEVSKLKGDVADTQRQLAEAEKVNAEQTRKINALEKLTKGTAWSVISVESEAETVDVPSGCYVADIKSVEGKSLAWNQLVDKEKFGSSATVSGITYTINADGSATMNGEATSSSFFTLISAQSYITIPKGHKVYFSGIEKASINTYWIQGKTREDGTYYLNNGNRIFETIGTDFRCNIRCEAGAVLVNETIRPKFTDLTAMFGAGNEPTSVDDPRIKFIESYANTHPEYNAGEIISADVTDVVVRGANLIEYFDGNSITSNGITYTKNADGSIKVKGTSTGTSSYFFFNRSEILKGEHYISLLNAKGSKIAIQFFDGSTFKEAPLGGSTTKGTFDNSNGYNVSVYIRIGSNVTVDEIIYPMLVKGSAEPTTYSPYRDPISLEVKSIISKYFPDGMHSAGSGNDVFDLQNGVAVQRVKNANPYNLEWTKSGGSNPYFFAQLPFVCVRPSSASENVNMLISGYTATHQGNWNTFDKSICYFYTSSNLTISRILMKNVDYNDKTVEEFKESLKGKELYIELATPIITPIDQTDIEALQKLDTEPHGSITFSNENHIAVKSTIEFAQNNAEV